MSEEKHDCPTVPNPSSGTVGHLAENVGQSRDTSGTGGLKSLARKVLRAAKEVGQSWDTTGTQVSQGPSDFVTEWDTPEATELEESRRRLEALDIRVSILDSGEMWIVQGDHESRQAQRAGMTVYSPTDMLLYCQISQHERGVLHGFKRRFGGVTEWKGADQTHEKP